MMKFATIACLVLAMAACALAAKEASLIFDRPCRYLEDGTPAYCPTTDIWNWKKAQVRFFFFVVVPMAAARRIAPVVASKSGGQYLAALRWLFAWGGRPGGVVWHALQTRTAF